MKKSSFGVLILSAVFMLSSSSGVAASILCRQSLQDTSALKIESEIAEVIGGLNYLMYEGNRRNVDIEIAQFIQNQVNPLVVEVSQDLTKHAQIPSVLARGNKANITIKKIEALKGDLNTLLKISTGEINLMRRLRTFLGDSLDRQVGSIVSRIHGYAPELKALRSEIETESFVLSNLEVTLKDHYEALQMEFDVLQGVKNNITGLVSLSGIDSQNLAQMKSSILEAIEAEASKISQIQLITSGLLAGLASGIERNKAAFHQLNEAIEKDLVLSAMAIGKFELLKNVTMNTHLKLQLSLPNEKEQALEDRGNKDKNKDKDDEKNSRGKKSLQQHLPAEVGKQISQEDLKKIKKLIHQASDEKEAEGALESISKFDSPEVIDLYEEIAATPSLRKYVLTVLRLETGRQRAQSLQGFNQILVKECLGTLQEIPSFPEELKNYFRHQPVTKRLADLLFNHIYRDRSFSEPLRLAVLDILSMNPDPNFAAQLRKTFEYETMESMLEGVRKVVLNNKDLNNKELKSSLEENIKNARHLTTLKKTVSELEKAMEVKGNESQTSDFERWISDIQNSPHSERGKLLLDLMELCTRPRACLRYRNMNAWGNFYVEISRILQNESIAHFDYEKSKYWPWLRPEYSDRVHWRDRSFYVMKLNLLLMGAHSGDLNFRFQLDEKWKRLKSEDEVDKLYILFARQVLDRKIGPDWFSENALKKSFEALLRSSRERFLKLTEIMKKGYRDTDTVIESHGHLAEAIEYRVFYEMLLRENLSPNAEFTTFIIENFGNRLILEDSPNVVSALSQIDFDAFSKKILSKEGSYSDNESLYLGLLKVAYFTKRPEFKDILKIIEKKLESEIEEESKILCKDQSECSQNKLFKKRLEDLKLKFGVKQ